MGIFTAEILVPQIVVRVELNERDGAVFSCDRAKNGEADGVIAAHANTTHAGFENRSDALLDTEKGIFNGKRIDGEIAEIGDAVLREGIHVKDGVPWADDRGLRPDISRPEARAGAIGGAPVERDAEESEVEFFGLRDVR